jgi:acyl-CoA synthetase (AMP-forming)/AMP-acid ligase II
VSFNLADLFERVVDAAPERTAIAAGSRRLSYAGLDERANRLAHHLAGAGVEPNQHIGLMAVNGTEYVEGMLAAFKLRAVPINVNYRYVDDELRYLFNDADLVGLIYHRQFEDRVASVAPDVSGLTTFLAIDDGTPGSTSYRAVDYEKALAKSSPDRPFTGGRSGDDLYCAYTGGTTGLPKGVVWRHQDIFFASLGGGDPLSMGNVIADADELAGRLPETGLVALPTPPLMHVSAHWMALSTLYGGGTIVIMPGGRFDPIEIWRLVGESRVNVLVIVGDAMARPLLDTLTSAPPDTFDTSSLFVVGSGGAVLSPSTKDRLAEVLPSVMVVDGFGASETGVMGARASVAGTGPATGPRFTVNEQTAVLDDDLRPVQPGSATIGRLARRGHIPLRYYNDPEKTAATFVEVEGVRWVLPGDMATVEEDGTVVLLGRGSVSINTGGEKVYPEEVEMVLKAHPAVADAVVVGVPDERWGERVVAVIEPVAGTTPTLEDLQHLSRQKLAGYKAPRRLCLVDRMVRSPSGKADYRWARDQANQALAREEG